MVRGIQQKAQSSVIANLVSQNPFVDTAHLTGIGLDSENNKLCNSAISLSTALASPALPSKANAHISAIFAGTTFAVTDIAPCPPFKIKSQVVESSPVNKAKHHHQQVP